MKANFLRNPFLFCLILAASLGFVYGSLFVTDPFLHYDDIQVIEPMRDIHSLSEYFAAFLGGKIFDLQPVRDLVSWLDFYVLSNFNYSLFHFTNVLVWFFTLLGLRKIALKNSWGNQQTWFLSMILILAVNPLYVTSVAWLTARKHLLAACFVVWATERFLNWIKSKRAAELIIANLFFLMAIFSQPIVILWPVCMALYLYLAGEKRRWKMLIPSFLIMFAVAYLNSEYYSGPIYMSLSFGIPKISGVYNSIRALRLFAVGRYVFQVLCPYWTSIAIYDPTSWRGLVGIFIIPITLLIFLKSSKLRLTIAGSAFFILMILPVVLRMTQIFGVDTYVVSASFGIYFLVANTSHHFFQQKKWFGTGIFILFFLSFSLVSRERVYAWENDLSLFADAWSIERSLSSGDEYLHELMHAKLQTEAVWQAEDMLRKYPESSVAQGVIANAIANDPELTPEQKIQKIYDYRFFTPYALDTLAKLEFKIKNYRNSEQLLLKILDNLEWNNVVRGLQEEFAARVYVSCTFAKEENCDSHANVVREKTSLQWNEDKYEMKKRELLKSP